MVDFQIDSLSNIFVTRVYTSSGKNKREINSVICR